MTMSRTVSASEAQSSFGAMVQWAEQNKEEVVIERRGVPAAVILSFEQYKELAQLRERERKRRALAALDELRAEVQRQNPDITAEEAYRAAGFSEEVIQETLQHNEELRQDRK